MEKKCTKCGEVKSLDEFNNFKKGKHGKAYQCKSCFKDYFKKYKQDNKEKIKEYNKEYNKKYKQDNKEKIKEYNKEYKQKYKQDNKEKIKEYNKEYYKNNKEKLSDLQKIYCKNKKESISNNKKRYYIENKYYIIKRTTKGFKQRMNTDIIFKLKHNIGCNIRSSLKKQGYSKKTKTFNILKCEYDFFIEFLNGIASNGYTYGVGNLQLDHVVPISLAQTEDEAYLLNHYSNYQLLSADENLAKSNSYVNPTNLKRVLEHHPNPDKIREIHARL
jgi:hypothetical protein